eukprot:TRINITY_DN54270_c0_g1_i2.p1 TRINITY_DN54270_c0_g1~~TRINITY_DN54270_c0_g1_i2.p1  ORF type:complete len:347 (+),score=175.35 TRINITY_DN54270_c0_g1_i2:31-1041(+)
MMKTKLMMMTTPTKPLLLAVVAVVVAWCSSSSAQKFEPTCDMTLSSGICLGGGSKLLVPDAQPNGLVGHWTFDDVHGIDSSKEHNHGAGVVPPGPGRSASGSSGRFDGETMFEAPSSPSLEELAVKEWTVSFWVYLSMYGQDVVKKQCPIVAKGAKGDNPFVASYDGGSRKLALQASKGAVKVETHARLPAQKWTHVAFGHRDGKFRVFVNGILDHEVAFKGKGLTYKPAPLYVGKTPWSDSDCKMHVLIDDLKVWARGPRRYDIEAESFGALGDVEASFVHLGDGCGSYSCSYDETRCRQGYHVCNQRENWSGAYSVARTMGTIKYIRIVFVRYK